MMETVVFVLAAAMVLGGAVGVVVCNHPVHAALSLVLTLFGVAVLFVALRVNGSRASKRAAQAAPTTA